MLPKVEEILFEHLAVLRDAREKRPPLLPEGTLHTSPGMAGQCARAIGLKVAKLEPTNPPDAKSLFNFYLGDAVHDAVQRSIKNKWSNAIIDDGKNTDTGGIIEDFLEGYADVLYAAEDNKMVVCEIKTVSDFGFELATGIELKSNGRWRKKDREIEGPKREHLLQAGIYSFIHKADYIAIVYARKTAAKDEPVTHEWRYRVKDHEEKASVEIERLKSIVNMVREGKVPARIYNDAIVENPKKVNFPCGYCNYLDACISLGPGVVEIK